MTHRKPDPTQSQFSTWTAGREGQRTWALGSCPRSTSAHPTLTPSFHSCQMQLSFPQTPKPTQGQAQVPSLIQMIGGGEGKGLQKNHSQLHPMARPFQALT